MHLGRGQGSGIQSSAVLKGLYCGVRFNDLTFNLLRPVEPGLDLLGMGCPVGQCQGRLLQKRCLGAGHPANGCNGPCVRDGYRNKKAECDSDHRADQRVDHPDLSRQFGRGHGQDEHRTDRSLQRLLAQP